MFLSLVELLLRRRHLALLTVAVLVADEQKIDVALLNLVAIHLLRRLVSRRGINLENERLEIRSENRIRLDHLLDRRPLALEFLLHTADEYPLHSILCFLR